MKTTFNNNIFRIDEQVESRINELSSYRYKNKIHINEVCFCDNEKEDIYDIPSKWTIKKQGEYWTGRDNYYWLKFNVQIPEKWNENNLISFFDLGKTCEGTNSGFESLLYIDNKPYHGVDANHKEVFLPKELKGENAEIILRLWSGLEGGGEPTIQEHKYKDIFIAELDVTVDKYIFLLNMAVQATKESINESDKVFLFNSLLKSINEIQWVKEKNNKIEFIKSVYNAANVLDTELNSRKNNNENNISAIGHTHIDVAWLWRLKHTREKAVRSFSTVLRLMEKYDDYVFLQSQPQLYQFIKEDYPEVYEKIKGAVATGKWEAGGAMWVEADCNLISGESLVRQVLHGKKFFRDEFDVDTDFLWLPDVFGYSWAMPQILRKSGVTTFVTSKISWNQYNKMPADTFYWRGIDGSEILTHFLTTPEQEQDMGEEFFATYNGVITPKTIKGTYDRYSNKELSNTQILSYGHGDGGGGVNREMLENIDAINKIPSMNSVKMQSAGKFFEGLHESIEKYDGYVHRWDGELYLEYHRGTYTSQGYTKKMNRYLEFLYRDTEILASIANVKTKNWSHLDSTLFEKGWKIILTNQFHDIIPGSSINEVYKDVVKDYGIAENIAKKQFTNAVSAICNTNNGVYTIFNQSSWTRNDIVCIDEPRVGNWIDSDNNMLDSQIIDNKTYVRINNISSLGFVNVSFVEKEKNEQKSSFIYKGNILETPFYKVEFNENGNIISLLDKKNDREIAKEGNQLNRLVVFEDRPLNFDAWDIDIFYNEKPYSVDDLVGTEVVSQGDLFIKIKFIYKYQQSTIKQDIIFYKDNARIDFETEVDWHERRQLLKVEFPVNIRSTRATYDIQFGNIVRNTHWNTSWDWAKYEVVGHKWADLSETGYGVALLNNCKYGYDIKDNNIRLSLLKGAIDPDQYADIGIHNFTYALLPHKDGWQEGNVEKEAFYINNKLYAIEKPLELDGYSFIKINKENIAVSAIKKSEYKDTIIIRLYEYEGRRTKAKLCSDETIEKWREVNLMEDGESDYNDLPLEFNIKPYEIKTFEVIFR